VRPRWWRGFAGPRPESGTGVSLREAPGRDSPPCSSSLRVLAGRTTSRSDRQEENTPATSGSRHGFITLDLETNQP
jgi:hypothetical protein